MKSLIGIVSLLIVMVMVLKETPEVNRSVGKLAAYRAGGQWVDYTSLASDGCTANNILRNDNPHPENTLESAIYAVENGADILHLNVHVTRDSKLVVFHDWRLDCATDGVGPVYKHTLAGLAELDAGYGYTYDNGETYPWRGHGYQIHQVQEYIEALPNTEFWLNIKSPAAAIETVETQLIDLAERVAPKPLTIILDTETEKQVTLARDKLRVVSKGTMKSCVLDYMLLGWSQVFPESCKNTVIFLPHEYVNIAWGWPEGFAKRMHDNDTEVFLWLKHTMMTPELDLRQQGIGVVTGDLHFYQQNPKLSRIVFHNRP